jgi:hypothetical protein
MHDEDHGFIEAGGDDAPQIGSVGHDKAVYKFKRQQACRPHDDAVFQLGGRNVKLRQKQYIHQTHIGVAHKQSKQKQRDEIDGIAGDTPFEILEYKGIQGATRGEQRFDRQHGYPLRNARDLGGEIGYKQEYFSQYEGVKDKEPCITKELGVAARRRCATLILLYIFGHGILLRRFCAQKEHGETP